VDVSRLAGSYVRPRHFIVNNGGFMTEALKGNPKLARERFHFIETKFQDYAAIVPEGTTTEDLEKPEYWSIVANISKAGGHIRVQCEDGSWEAECSIRGVGPTWVSVKVLHIHRFEPEKIREEDVDYRVYWRGQHHQWAIQRLSDKAIIKNNLTSRMEADSALIDHRKAMSM